MRGYCDGLTESVGLLDSMNHPMASERTVEEEAPCPGSVSLVPQVYARKLLAAILV
jgi:hypothetical protein